MILTIVSLIKHSYSNYGIKYKH